jgi:hypothetical protein
MKNNQFQHFFNPNLCVICHLYKSRILCYTIYVIKRATDRQSQEKKLKNLLTNRAECAIISVFQEDRKEELL